MPNWIQNALHTVGNAVDDLADNVMDGLDFGPELMESLQGAGQSTNTLARETTDLCESTFVKSDQMMEFCSDLKDTLATSTEGGITADTLDTIQDLLSGEKVQTAMGLAKEMSDHAKACVEKSVQMVCFLFRRCPLWQMISIAHYI